MCIGGLNFRIGKLKSTEKVDSARAATATSHKDWLDTKSVDAPKGLSKFFSSLKGKQRNEETLESHIVFEKYYRQGEARKSDYQVDLMQISRFDISPYSTSSTTKSRRIPQLNPGQSSGQTGVVRLSLD